MTFLGRFNGGGNRKTDKDGGDDDSSNSKRRKRVTFCNCSQNQIHEFDRLSDDDQMKRDVWYSGLEIRKFEIRDAMIIKLLDKGLSADEVEIRSQQSSRGLEHLTDAALNQFCDRRILACDAVMATQKKTANSNKNTTNKEKRRRISVVTLGYTNKHNKNNKREYRDEMIASAYKPYGKAATHLAIKRAQGDQQYVQEHVVRNVTILVKKKNTSTKTSSSSTRLLLPKQHHQQGSESSSSGSIRSIRPPITRRRPNATTITTTTCMEVVRC